MINSKFQSFKSLCFFLCNITSKILGSLSRQRLYMYIWNISRVICVLWKVSETFDRQHLITDAFHIRIVLWVNWYTISKPDNSNLQVYLFTDYLDISKVFISNEYDYIYWIFTAVFYSLRKIAVGKIQLCHNSYV